MDKSKKKLLESFLVPLTFPAILWIVHSVSVLLNIDFSNLGLLPRNWPGIIGVIAAPLIHANYSHLVSNTFPLIISGWVIFFFYNKISQLLFIFIYVVTGITVWLFAREVYHIGASGIVYGFVSFLFFSGIFRKDNKSIALSLIITFLYGGMVWGILPGMKDVSWESHLFGAVTGLAAAFIFRKVDPPEKKYDWEDEPDDFDVKDLEVSYDPEKNKFNKL